MVITKFVLRMHVRRNLTHTKKLDMRRTKSHSSLVFYMCIAGCIPIENTLIGVDHTSLLYITVPTADNTGWVKSGWIFRTVRSYQKYIALDSVVLGPIFCLHLMHKHILLGPYSTADIATTANQNSQKRRRDKTEVNTLV